jgi:hypothetical protein
VPGATTLFQIGSLTKVFTGLALARRVEEGDVSIDAAADELLASDLRDATPASYPPTDVGSATPRLGSRCLGSRAWVSRDVSERRPSCGHRGREPGEPRTRPCWISRTWAWQGSWNGAVRTLPGDRIAVVNRLQ